MGNQLYKPNPTEAKYGTGPILKPTAPILGVNRMPPRGNPRPVITSTEPPLCDERNILGGGPDMAFVTLTVPVGNAVADVPLQVPKASRFIMLVSCTTVAMNNSLYMHFTPTNKQYNSGQIQLTGTEQWFPFSNGSAGATAMTKIGLFYRFKKPLPQFIYFDIGTETGAVITNYTFMLGNDVEEIGQLMNSTS